MKKFGKADGYTTKELLHYGIDHLSASIKLLEINPRLYDSAGYLAHMGIELYLKAMMLDDVGYFINAHGFDKIRIRANLPKSYFEISKENAEIYRRLDEFAEMRYPIPGKAIEIGTEDKEQIIALSEEIFNHFPEPLKKETMGIDHTDKGNRILMRKKKE